MAIVTRYFSTAAAGDGTGSSWANRAILFTGGAWSTVITGFDFSGSDALLPLIGPGTYSITAALAAGSFTNAPTIANLMMAHSCDSSGVALTPPDPDWVSAQAAWDATALPVLATTTNIATTSLNNAIWRLIKFTASGRTGGSAISGFKAMDWCVVDDSSNNASAAAIGVANANITNSVITMTGAAYDYALNLGINTLADNNRIVGVTGSSGDRSGVLVNGTTAPGTLTRNTIISHGGLGVEGGSANAAQLFLCANNVIANNGGTGIKPNSTAAQTAVHVVSRNMITGNGGYGVDAQSAANVWAANNRLRDNTSGNFNGMGNYPTDQSNYTTDGDDQEYVDSANGDFRIRAGSVIWGSGYGAADQPRRRQIRNRFI